MTWTYILGFDLIFLTIILIIIAFRFKVMQRIMEDNLDQIQQEKHLDPRTNIPNSIALEEYINESRETSDPYFLFYVEVSEYYKICEHYNVSVADHYIAEVVADIRRVTVGGNCYRMKDNAIVISMPGKDADLMLSTAENLSYTFNRPVTFKNQCLMSEVRIGIVRVPIDGKGFETLHKRMLIALAHVEDNEVCNFVVYKKHLELKVKDNFKMEAFIDDAIEENTFELYLQPIVNLWTEELTKVEVLLRHSKLSDYCSNIGELITFAEETGQIRVIDRWVIKEAFKIMASDFFSKTDMVFSINLSAQTFSNVSSLEMINQLANQYGIAKNKVNFEITEYSLMKSIDYSRWSLSEFKSKGYQLSLDDFGTGYSSLNHLNSMPFDVIKIDKSYVDAIETSSYHSAIIRMVVSLSEELGMVSVAEGIETIEQKRCLMKLGCHLGQGYLFYRPMPVDDFIEAYNKHQTYNSDKVV